MAGQSERVIRLIAADLDGTLLNSEHQVSPFTEQALRAAMAQGVLFTAATGKSFPSTAHLRQQFDMQVPIICGNGTLVHAPDGSILHEALVPRACAIEAIGLARAAGLTSVVTAGTELLATTWDSGVEVLVAHFEPVPRVIPDLEKALQQNYRPHKVIFVKEGDPETVAEFSATLGKVFAGRAQVLRSGLASLVELLPLDVTKGTALTFVLDYLGIPAQQAIAFGDNCNDLDMIRRAGIGVAMGHAPDAVRRHADYITGTNDEDGVGHAIHKFVLASQPVNSAS